ncbi:MAG TPA: hypothetical protein VD794_11275 [Flavisolibacter sp.]|nr:hypothetical protein [Flavisolibacter sp.]
MLQLWLLLAAGQSTRTSPNLLQTSMYTQQTTAFSFTANQAALAYTSTLMSGVYGERRFMLQELSWYQVAAALPTRSGNFGLKGTYFGATSNAEMEIGLAYGRKLGDKVAIGGQFNYYTQRMPQYQSSHAVSVEAGLLLKVNEQVHASFHIYNPNNASLGKTKEQLPAIYTLGLGYVPSDRLVVTGEIQKIEDEKVNIKTAVCYLFDKRLYAKAGVNTVNAVYVLGGGVKLSSLSLEVTTSIHPQLGVTPGLLLLFHKKEKGL